MGVSLMMTPFLSCCRSYCVYIRAIPSYTNSSCELSSIIKCHHHNIQSRLSHGPHFMDEQIGRKRVSQLLKCT